MTSNPIARYLAPWTFKRREQQRRLDALRQRDGDNCRRCRRPMRFDLPAGHDQAPKLEPILSGSKGAALENLCLCHTRCNAEAADNTPEVMERMRLKVETAVKSRKVSKPARRRAAA